MEKHQLPAGSVYTYYAPKGFMGAGPIAFGSIALDCKKCGQPCYARFVKGILNTKKACTARCLSATGTTCECACAGKNHGASHG